MEEEISIELRQRSVYIGDVELEEFESSAPEDDRDPEESASLKQEITSIGERLGAKLEPNISRHFVDGSSRGGSTTSFIESLLIAFAASGAAVAFINVAKEILLKWMTNSGQRSVRLKCGDYEVEIKGEADIDKAAEALNRLMAKVGDKEDTVETDAGGALTPIVGEVGEEGNGEIESRDCRCCDAGLTTDGPRVCPECGHVFQGNGWDGIDAHWRAHHEAIMSYETFWTTLCASHRGAPSI